MNSARHSAGCPPPQLRNLIQQLLEHVAQPVGDRRQRLRHRLTRPSHTPGERRPNAVHELLPVRHPRRRRRQHRAQIDGARPTEQFKEAVDQIRHRLHNISQPVNHRLKHRRQPIRDGLHSLRNGLPRTRQPENRPQTVQKQLKIRAQIGDQIRQRIKRVREPQRQRINHIRQSLIRMVDHPRQQRPHRVQQTLQRRQQLIRLRQQPQQARQVFPPLIQRIQAVSVTRENLHNVRHQLVEQRLRRTQRQKHFLDLQRPHDRRHRSVHIRIVGVRCAEQERLGHPQSVQRQPPQRPLK